MAPQKAQGSGNSPGREGARSPGGQAEREDSAGRCPAGPRGSRAGHLLGLSALAALLVSAPQDTLAASLRERFFSVDTWGGNVSEPGESTHLPKLPGTKLTSLGPHPRPGPGPLRRVLPGCMRGNASVCWRHRSPASLPARVLPEAPPAEPFLPPAGPRGRSWGREWGRRAERAPGKPAGGGECWAGCLQRALSQARSRCRCCPCLRCRPAGLWST